MGSHGEPFILAGVSMVGESNMKQTNLEGSALRGKREDMS